LRSLLGVPIDAKAEARFWAKVQKRGPTECWPWTASKHKLGYGNFRIGGRSGATAAAHRVSACLSHPDFDESLDYLHSCDNPPCCNPAHLIGGTHQDNMTDMTVKERNRTARPGNGFIKIDANGRLDIAAMFAGGLNKSAIARVFDISPTRVRQILAEIAA